MVQFHHAKKTQQQVAAIIVALRMDGKKVHDFAPDGYSCEFNGVQVFRAVALGNERFEVRYDPAHVNVCV